MVLLIRDLLAILTGEFALLIVAEVERLAILTHDVLQEVVAKVIVQRHSNYGFRPVRWVTC